MRPYDRVAERVSDVNQTKNDDYDNAHSDKDH